MRDTALKPKVALITGAARRVGREIACCLHRAGMQVVLHYHQSQEEAESLSCQLNEARPNSAIALSADLNDKASIDKLSHAAFKQWDRLDVLVNNASRFYRTPCLQVTESEWDDLMTSNVKAPFFLAQACAPFLAQHEGSIINIIDIHAERSISDYSIYCLSKSSLMTLTKLLAKELGSRIRVNGVSPGAVMWPEGENSLSMAAKEEIVENTLLKRSGAAEDIASAVLFFVRDATYVTGQILAVDGGRLLTGW